LIFSVTDNWFLESIMKSIVEYQADVAGTKRCTV